MEDIFKHLGKIVKVEQGIKIELNFEEILSFYDALTVINDNKQLFNEETITILNKLKNKVQNELYLKRLK